MLKRLLIRLLRWLQDDASAWYAKGRIQRLRGHKVEALA
jgi:hypothetical protein